MPSAASFSSLEGEGDKFFSGSGDIKDCFYHMAVPEALSNLFTLPRVSASLLGLSCLSGEALGPSDLIVPCLKVLPMAWN